VCGIAKTLDECDTGATGAVGAVSYETIDHPVEGLVGKFAPPIGIPLELDLAAARPGDECIGAGPVGVLAESGLTLVGIARVLGNILIGHDLNATEIGGEKDIWEPWFRS
jgi:hypothetical protein